VAGDGLTFVMLRKRAPQSKGCQSAPGASTRCL
jgi:hypothetical protein